MHFSRICTHGTCLQHTAVSTHEVCTQCWRRVTSFTMSTSITRIIWMHFKASDLPSNVYVCLSTHVWLQRLTSFVLSLAESSQAGRNAEVRTRVRHTCTTIRAPPYNHTSTTRARSDALASYLDFLNGTSLQPAQRACHVFVWWISWYVWCLFVCARTKYHVHIHANTCRDAHIITLKFPIYFNTHTHRHTEVRAHFKPRIFTIYTHTYVI